MKGIFASLLLLATLSAGAQQTNEPFGWATVNRLENGDLYGDDHALTGGGEGSCIVLKSNGLDMRDQITKALKDYQTVVLDGSAGPFMISRSMRIADLRGRTILGVNGALLSTQFKANAHIHEILTKAGVRAMSDQGNGGTLSNGVKVAEERELNTRQTLIDDTGDASEAYRDAGIFSISRCEDVIIRNIAFEGPGPIDVGGSDLLTLSGCKHVWVDHCSFTDGLDGNFDINQNSDLITVSWCTFQYTDQAFDHKASNLIASSENVNREDSDAYNITFAFCRWGKGCEVRMPVVRFGKVHVLNCYYDCAGNYAPAINARIRSEVLVEACYFDKGVKNVFEATPDALAWQFKGCTFREKSKPASEGSVELPYTYQAVPSARVPRLVKEGAGATLDLAAPAPSVKFTIHMIGDSTMADKDITGGNPERGWGMVFENFVDDGVRVINYAKNGRSTKSCIDEGIWATAVANMQAGDYLFVQFAHNDEKENKPAVYAAPWGAYQDNLRMFIRVAREKGVTPVLLTPVARRHFGADGIMDEGTHGEYPAAMKAVAKEMGVTLIDMEKATIDWIKAAGDLASRPYFMWVAPNTCPAIPAGREDNTHSTPRGARRNCEIVSDSIRVKIPELAAHLVRYDFVVDKDGRGDFLTVQEAVNALPDNSRTPITVLVKPGLYKERVVIPSSKTNVVFKGCGADMSVITYSLYARMKWPDSNEEVGTFGSSSIIVDASDVRFVDLGLRNDAGSGNLVGQAVAVTTTGDRIMFERCRISAHQDTFYTGGRYSNDDGASSRLYFRNCTIEGTTDFIFGSGIALFEDCHIHSGRNSYVTAASTEPGQKYGYVFRNCRLTADKGVDKVHLGRPWRADAHVVYLECELGSHIVPAGWHNWNDPAREKTAYYAEYKNFGPGADTAGRVGWSHQLTDAQAAEYTWDKIMNEGRTSKWVVR